MFCFIMRAILSFFLSMKKINLKHLIARWVDVGANSVGANSPWGKTSRDQLEYSGHVVQHCRCHCRVHTPMIHAASHVNHEKQVAWFSFSVHACGSVPMVIGHLMATRASL